MTFLLLTECVGTEQAKVSAAVAAAGAAAAATASTARALLAIIAAATKVAMPTNSERSRAPTPVTPRNRTIGTSPCTFVYAEQLYAGRAESPSMTAATALLAESRKPRKCESSEIILPAFPCIPPRRKYTKRTKQHLTVESSVTRRSQRQTQAQAHVEKKGLKRKLGNGLCSRKTEKTISEEDSGTENCTAQEKPKLGSEIIPNPPSLFRGMTIFCVLDDAKQDSQKSQRSKMPNWSEGKVGKLKVNRTRISV